MKRSSLLILVLASSTMLACSPNNAPSSSSEDLSSSSQTGDTALVEALAQLKEGYNATAVFRGNYISSGSLESQSFSRQQMLNSHDFFALRDVAFDNDGNLTQESLQTRFEIVKADEEGDNYALALSSGNEQIADYDNPSYAGTRFDPIYDNPFAYLGVDDFTKNGNSYDIPEGHARLIAEHFGVNVAPYVERPFDHASFVLGDEGFASFSFGYELITQSGNLLRFSLGLNFLETGNVAEPVIDPIEDDGTDKSGLEQAIKKVSGDNFTLTVTLTPGALMMMSPFKYRFYFDGTRVFAYTNLYYYTPSLGSGDFVLLPSEDGNMTLNAYDYTSNSFILQEGTQDPYAEQKPAIDKISMALLTNVGGSYSANLGGGSNSLLVHEALFNSFIPEIIHSNTMKYSANGLSIAIDDNGYPSITETFFYDMSGDGFGENETLTITYSDVGTTVLPDEVSALLGE